MEFLRHSQERLGSLIKQLQAWFGRRLIATQFITELPQRLDVGRIALGPDHLKAARLIQGRLPDVAVEGRRMIINAGADNANDARSAGSIGYVIGKIDLANMAPGKALWFRRSRLCLRRRRLRGRRRRFRRGSGAWRTRRSRGWVVVIRKGSR